MASYESFKKLNGKENPIISRNEKLPLDLLPSIEEHPLESVSYTSHWSKGTGQTSAEMGRSTNFHDRSYVQRINYYLFNVGVLFFGTITAIGTLATLGIFTAGITGVVTLLPKLILSSLFITALAATATLLLCLFRQEARDAFKQLLRSALKSEKDIRF